MRSCKGQDGYVNFVLPQIKHFVPCCFLDVCCVRETNGSVLGVPAMENAISILVAADPLLAATLVVLFCLELLMLNHKSLLTKLILLC